MTTEQKTDTRKQPQSNAAAEAAQENDPIQDRCNEAYCAVLRLLKAGLAAIVTAGSELAAAKCKLGFGFDEFVTKRLPFRVAEAEAMVTFAAEAGLDPARLTAADEVPLARLLKALALLGGLYMEQANIDIKIAGNRLPADNAAAKVPAEPAKPDKLSGYADAVMHGAGNAGDTEPAPADTAPLRSPAITAAQRRFLAERSVKLLLQVTKGELTPEAAMRQAEKMPVNKKRTAGLGQ